MDLKLTPNQTKLLSKLKECDCGMTEKELYSWSDGAGLLFPIFTFRELEQKGVARVQEPDQGSKHPKRYKATKQAWEI